MHKPLNVLNFIKTQHWCIRPEWLKAIHSVANRDGLELLNSQGLLPESISSKIGTRLDNTRSVSVRGSTAIIPITGVLTPRASMFSQVSGMVSSETILQDFTTAIEDQSIESIILQIDSPGGAVTGISDVANAIFNARGTKPIYTHVVGEMASAALWIGTSSDKVFASPTAVIGSIGTVATIDTTTEEGVIEIVSTQSPKKRMDMTSDEGKADLIKIIDAISGTFIDSVARNRNTTSENVEANFGQGGIFIAAKAEEVGLIDGIASFEDTLAMLDTNKPQTTQTQTNKRISAMTITKESIQAEHPTIAEAFRAEGSASVLDAVKADRLRASQILANAPKGFEAEAQKAIADGISAGDFALGILTAQQAKLSKIDSANDKEAAPLQAIGAQGTISDSLVDADKDEQAKIDAAMAKILQK